MRVVAIFPLIEEPAVGPDLGRSENLLPGAQDDPHRLVVEYHWKAGHARQPSNNLAAGRSCYVPTCQRVTDFEWSLRVTPTRSTPCRADAAA